MSTKKEIAEYIDENLKKGYTKDQIKTVLLKYSPEKDVMKQLIERAEPKLLETYKKEQITLIILVVITLILKFYTTFIEGISRGAEFGLGTGYGITMGLISLILPIIFFIGLIKSRAWSYVIFLGYGIINILYTIPSILSSLFGEIPAEEIIEVSSQEIRTIAIIYSAISMLVYLGITILSFYCGKKIHPDYKIKDLFSAGSSETGAVKIVFKVIGIIFAILIGLIVIGLILNVIRG